MSYDPLTAPGPGEGLAHVESYAVGQKNTGHNRAGRKIKIWRRPVVWLWHVTPV